MNEHQQRALILDLDGLADLWTTFRVRHENDSHVSAAFCDGLEVCARQLTEALDRAKQLADADA